VKVSIITKEYPPEVYGGAGVHVTELAKALKPLIEVGVYCFGEPRNQPGVTAFSSPDDLIDSNSALQTLAIDLKIAHSINSGSSPDLIHSHTWYANYAGILASKIAGVPHVLTAHSLEPLRPWKREQLAGGYAISSMVEKDAYASADGIIAVSHAMKNDILECYSDVVDPKRLTVIHNGINVEDFELALSAQSENRQIAKDLGVNPDLPTAVFVGRITRQKGITYLLKAIAQVVEPIQFVLAASAPDTKKNLEEVEAGIYGLLDQEKNIVWLSEALTRRELMAILGVSDVFLCPSIYEPLGIVNLEAMACKLPVLASRVGGIPEVVEDGQTGWLIDYSFKRPKQFVKDLAEGISMAFDDQSKAQAMGQRGYERASIHFAWSRIAEQTNQFYSKLIKSYE
jgi:starch synthase